MKEISDIERSMDIIPEIIKKFSYPEHYTVNDIKNDRNKEKTTSDIRKRSYSQMVKPEPKTLNDIENMMNGKFEYFYLMFFFIIGYIKEEEKKMKLQKKVKIEHIEDNPEDEIHAPQDMPRLLDLFRKK
jgi:hypothetical protein